MLPTSKAQFTPRKPSSRLAVGTMPLSSGKAQSSNSMATPLSAGAATGLAAGASKVHIYDTPLEVLAALLSVGFVLTLLVRPLKKAEL